MQLYVSPKAKPGDSIFGTKQPTLALAMLESQRFDSIMDDTEALRKHEALKARNRKAQKRYRARKIEEAGNYKEKAESLSLDLAVAQAETDSLREEKEALQAQLASLNRVTGLQLKAGKSSELTHQGAEGLAAYREAVWKRYNSDEDIADMICRSFDVIRSCTGTLTKEKIDNCTMAEAHQLYQELVEFMAKCLASGQEGYAKLHTVLPLTMRYNMLMMQRQPLPSLALRAAEVEAIAANNGPPPSGFWQRIAGIISLTQQQRTQLEGHKQMLLARIRAVLSVRAASVRSLKSELPSQACHAPEATSTYLTACALSQRLEQCMDEECRAACDFGFSVLQEVLTPVQQAQLVVAAQPYKVDVLSFCLAALGQLDASPQMNETLDSFIQQTLVAPLDEEAAALDELLGLDDGLALPGAFGDCLWDMEQMGQGCSLMGSTTSKQLTQETLTDQHIQAYLLRTDMPWLGLL